MGSLCAGEASRTTPLYGSNIGTMSKDQDRSLWNEEAQTPKGRHSYSNDIEQKIQRLLNEFMDLLSEYETNTNETKPNQNNSNPTTTFPLATDRMESEPPATDQTASALREADQMPSSCLETDKLECSTEPADQIDSITLETHEVRSTIPRINEIN